MKYKFISFGIQSWYINPRTTPLPPTIYKDIQSLYEYRRIAALTKQMRRFTLENTWDYTPIHRVLTQYNHEHYTEDLFSYIEEWKNMGAKVAKYADKKYKKEYNLIEADLLSKYAISLTMQDSLSFCGSEEEIVYHVAHCDQTLKDCVERRLQKVLHWMEKCLSNDWNRASHYHSLKTKYLIWANESIELSEDPMFIDGATQIRDLLTYLDNSMALKQEEKLVLVGRLGDLKQLIKQY